MTEVFLATEREVPALAALHLASLPGSMLSKLGIAALERYYAFARLSPKEVVWSAVDGMTVIGGCVLSNDPATMLARFTRSAPLRFARELAAATLEDGELRRRIASRFRDGLYGERKADTSDGPHTPEVTQIFTDASRRGQGIGAALLRTCEDNLRGRGVQKYFVHTHQNDNDAGIRFYQREGFVTVGQARSFGEAFVVMQKDL
jgi:GNAT superfamily N-acetyltransferase